MDALSGFVYEWDAIKDEILFSEDVQNLNLPKKLISSKTSKEVLELMHPDDNDEYLLNIKKHLKDENQILCLNTGFLRMMGNGFGFSREEEESGMNLVV